MKANRTHTPPPLVEMLGDGTFYYNFNVQHKVDDDGVDVYDYDQVRCPGQPDVEKIQTAVDAAGYNHTVTL